MQSLESGFRAVVVGASGAIGAAIADALASDPRAGAVLRLSRAQTGLDLRDERSVAAAAEAVDGEIDLLFVATGGLTIDGVGPEKALSQIAPDALLAQYALNAVGPALVLKHFSKRLPRRRRALVGALTAKVGSIGDNRMGGWYAYRAAKAAANQLVHTAAIELARSRPELVLAALHPGTVESPLSAPFRPAGAASAGVMTPDESARRLLGVLDGLGASDSGGFFAYDGERLPW